VTCEQGEATGQNRKRAGLLEEDQALTRTQQQISGAHRWEWKKKGSAREKEGYNDDKIGVLWAWDTDGIQAREASARGDGERGTLTKMPQRDRAAHGCGSGARCSCDLSTSAAGDGHREGQSPECSNKLAVLTGRKGKKKQPAREKEGHSNNAPVTK